MKFENTDVWGFEHALRGMRNPLNSWDKGDSGYIDRRFNDQFHIGKNDLDLAQRLIKAGSEYRKFLRQIFASVDITAPMYWFGEFDTYKVGTVANSTSKMHKLASTPITKDCFEMDDFEAVQLHCYPNVGTFEVDEIWEKHIENCEKLRLAYVATKNKLYWKELIRLLPESWLQKRTVTMNYENILNMYMQRKNHKLNEWSGKDDSSKTTFCSWVLSLPYAKEFFIEPFEPDFKVVKAESRSRAEQERQELARGELC